MSIRKTAAIAAIAAMPSRRTVFAFCAALLLTSLWGSLVQTQWNLKALTDLYLVIEPRQRWLTSLQDIAGFGPIYAGVVLAAWLPAFASAAWLVRRRLASAVWAYPLAAGVGLVVAIRVVDAVAPMPVLIYATRSTAGLLSMALGGVLGGALFVWWRGAPSSSASQRRTSAVTLR